MEKRAGDSVGILLVLVLLMNQACALEADYDTLIVNSEDWVDAYSSVTYANLEGKTFNFVTSNEQSTRLPTTLTEKKILLIESAKLPKVSGYANTLRNAGFTVTEMRSEGGKSLNLVLAEDLDTKDFIIVGDAYGYDAVSVTPYAVASKSYVLVVGADNVDAVVSFLKTRNGKVLVYGHLPDAVREKLSGLDPETIDFGDRFDNNIEIVRKYRAISPIDQVTLTSGDFMEAGLMAGAEPILFIGADSVPDQVAEYVKAGGIRVGVLVGNDLVASAQSLKSKTGISVFLKFGQGAGSGATSMEVRNLDFYYLPNYPLNVSVSDVGFNSATSELEVTYKNNADAFAYVKPTVKLYVGEELAQTVGESEPILIEARGESGSSYEVNLSEYTIQGTELSANVFVQYGESKKSLEKSLDSDLAVEVVKFRDESDVEVVKVTYQPKNEKLVVSIKSLGPDCYVRPSVRIFQGGEEKILDAPVTKLPSGATKDFRFDVALSEDDLRDYEQVPVTIAFGERENFLLSKLLFLKRLEVASDFDLTSVAYPAAVALLLLVVAVLLLQLRKKNAGEEKEERPKQ